MEKENIWPLYEMKKKENVYSSKIFFGRGEENPRRKRRKIFGEVKYFCLWRIRKRRNKGRIIFGKGIYLFGEKKSAEGKGGKYLEKDNSFCSQRRRKRRKIFGEGKYVYAEKKKNCPVLND